MKRKIALLVFIILVLSLTLAACNKTQATDISTRWEAETHVFNISLADFLGESDDFASYTADGIEELTGEYSKDIAFSNEFSNWDELRPEKVVGTYTVTITPPDDPTGVCYVKTTQEMCVVYKLNKFDANSEVLDPENGALASQDQLDKYNLQKDDETVILWSSTETEVYFTNTRSQTPQSSHVIVNGFYAGHVEQKLSRYDVSTEYNYDEKRPVAKITINGNTTEYKFRKNSAGTFIDSNQIFLYLRSLDKSSSSFQDSPSKSVFNPYNQTLQTAYFGLTYENGTRKLSRNVLLTDKTRENSLLATRLNVVSVTVGGNPFMMQENLPDTLADNNLDLHDIPGGTESMFTTVRFRVGYFVFEIDYQNELNTTNWNDVWTALKPVVDETPADD